MNSALFRNKLVFAPMVRVSKLPMRLLALDYGADLVYCEEVIDFKMLQSRKVENIKPPCKELLGTTEFLLSDDSVAFQTCPREKNHLVFQMGTSNAKRAVKVAKMVEPYVAAIDVNMGCPKEFSTKEGMGAALLDHPETITEILTSLVESVSIPVTCKIRIKPDLTDTLELVRLIEATGVSAVAVHGRTRNERPRDDNRDDVIAKIVSSTRLPVIANGGSSRIHSHNDIATFKASTTASSVMLARAAMYNPSIFLPSPQPLPVDVVIKHFLKYALDYDSHPMHLKYVIQNLLREELTSTLGQALLAAKTVLETCSLWDFADYYHELQTKRESRCNGDDNDKGQGGGADNDDDSNRGKRVEEGLEYKVVMEGGCEVFQMDYKCDSKDRELLNKAKMRLYNWTVKHKLKPPAYQTILHPRERSYRSVLTVNHLRFTSSVWNKSDKFSQRSSAHVCLSLMRLPSFSHLMPPDDDADDGADDGANKLNGGNDDDDVNINDEDGDIEKHNSIHKKTKKVNILKRLTNDAVVDGDVGRGNDQSNVGNGEVDGVRVNGESVHTGGEKVGLKRSKNGDVLAKKIKL